MEGEIEGERWVLFPKLESLVLEDLPKLRKFCHANLLECPSLQTLTIKECPLLNAFIGGHESSLFNERILFPKLKVLELNEMKMQKIWDVDHLVNAAEETTCWLQNLTSLNVKECRNLSYLFTSAMVKNLAKLKQLRVSYCNSIEEIVALTERETTREIKLSFPKMDNIYLEGLPNLKRFCQANLLECVLLRELVIRKCSELDTFMSANDSSSSENLTTLFTEKVAFPNVEELQIADFPFLTSIFPESLVLTLQQLVRLRIENCPKIDLFGFNNTQELNDALAKVISILKYCYLDVGGGLSLEYTNQQFKLQILDCGLQVPPILFALLKSFPILDEFEVSRNSIVQLFPCEPDHLAAATDGHGMHTLALARIGRLTLCELSNMKHIWSENSSLKYHVIPEVLEVDNCDSLAPPSPTLFKNLTSLSMQRCPMLIRLVTSSSTTKSLVNLKELTVSTCDSLEEILSINDQWDGLPSNNEYIVFEKLKFLQLQDLNSLTSFCSTSNFNFRFPSLDRVIVDNCPKMKFFSKGALSTPNLMKVWPSRAEEETPNEGRWEGDLNSTIRELFEEMKGKSDMMLDKMAASVHLGVVPILEFEEFESRVLVSNQIVAALKDPNVNKVGIYGMSGTGKSTLAKKIGAELHLDWTFRDVLLADVSNNNQPDLFNIQKQIADGLKIKLQGETLNNRATHLHEELQQRRGKLLIILKDIWSRLELEKVGIIVGKAEVKILMTSRSEMVLENEMDSTSNFKLDSLLPNDARKLFDKIVGGDSQYSKWPLVAQQVIKECGGIPIILVTIARALRNEALGSWEDALIQLKQFDGEGDVEEGYKMIEKSYMFLKNEEIKKLFLLCAYFDHRSIAVEDLVKYAIGLNLFIGCRKVKEVRNRLHIYLNNLKECCLLQDFNELGIITVHDVVHNFASFVAVRDHNVLSVANDDVLEEWPPNDYLENISAISLLGHLPPNQMLPAAFDNPKLELFLMFRSKIDASFQIPDNFFAGMKGLKLMNLKRMSLSPVLVSSLSALVNLRTLCLDHCKLSDITVTGELWNLQALSLVGSSIVLVPKEMGKLGGTLKLLDLRDCCELETIASGVISRLTLLEDLRIGASFMRWKRLEGRDKSSDNADEAKVASLQEFKNLLNLIHLEICIPDQAKMFPKDLVFNKLETFKIHIGNRYWSSNEYILTRTLEISESSTVVEFDGEGTKALMARAEGLWLEGVTSSVGISEMEPRGFPELKHLTVDSGDGIQYIVRKSYNNCVFPKLVTLDLYFLDKLERVCDDHDHPLLIGSFGNLRVLNVSECPLLNDLLSSNLARCLFRLKEMRVENCESMESIIVSRESENEEEIQIGFSHQLQILELNDLPCLVSFFSFKQIEGLPSPTHLFNKKIVFPKLEVLMLSTIEVEKIWDEESAISGEMTCWLQNLTILNVDGCNNLSYLFTSSMVKSLSQLKELAVDNCESIEEIVASTERAAVGDVQLCLPNLDNLMLNDLPKLRRFCEANLLKCQLLRKLAIESCSNLKTFVSAYDSSSSDINSTTLFNEKVAFPNIEELEINGIGSFKMICGNQLHPNSFSRLKMLTIDGVVTAFTPSMSRRALTIDE